MSSVNEADYRHTMRRWVSGVTVLTAEVAGADHAMTASSFTSLSLDPVLVLVALGRDGRFRQVVSEGLGVGISILAADQQDVARRLSIRGRDLGGQLDGIPTTRGRHSGALLLDEAVATLEGRVAAIHPGGDHDIVVIEVLEVAVGRPDAPVLAYVDGGFHALP